MKKNFKRWLAFLLAVVLVATTCMFSSDSFLRASEDENGAEDAVEETIETQELIVPQPEEPEEAPAPVVEETVPAEETQPETQEQTPEQPQEPVGDVPAEDGTEVTPEAPAAEEAVVPTQTPEEEKPEETPASVVTPAPEATETPEATTAPTASATPEASASPTPTATPDGEEEAVNYAYEIRYYYDGVEDEESRVVKGDGVLDELILDADTLKENVTRDGKVYVLDKIENGNGRITKREEDNVVSVYYVLAGEEEPEEKFSYEIRFFYNNVENEESRIKGEDLLDKQILDDDSLDQNVVFEEKNYVLDHIENKEGKITENSDSNVVKVCYVLGEEAAVKYQVTLSHILSTDIGQFRSQEDIALTDKDFVNGNADLMIYAYGREGMKVTSTEVSVSKEDFDGDNRAYAEIEYGVAEGYIAVRKSNSASTGASGMRRTRAVYVGTFDDVEIVPVGQIPVSISFIFENGSIAKETETIMAKQEGESYKFVYEFSGIPGYTPKLQNADGYILDNLGDNKYQIKADALDGSLERDNIDVIFEADNGVYTVITRIPNFGFKTVDLNSKESYTETVSNEMTDVKVGELTEVTAGQKDGFTAKTVLQQEVKADGSTQVIVEYVRNTYTVTYNTNGGSYIPALKGVYEEEVEVYSKEGGTEPVCGMEEHTHVSSCYRNNGWLKCKRTEHTHNDGCYSAAFNPAPTKEGYTFTGWYSDENCTIPADEKEILAGDVTVYAGWTAQNVNYTVVYLKEIWDNGTNSSYYAYYASSTKSGKVGDTVSGDSGISPGTGYKYGESTTAAIKADGSTVVETKYDLIRYTIIFNLGTDNTPVITMDGKEYHKSEYQIKDVVLGQDISDRWPTSDNTVNGTKKLDVWSRIGKTDQKTKIFEVTVSMLPSDNTTTMTYTASWTDTTTEARVEYWLQKTDGSGYEKSDKYSQSFINSNGLTAKDIDGFTKHSGTPSGYKGDETTGGRNPQTTVYRFYYDRTQFSITYRYKAQTLQTNKVYFEADISGDVYNYTPNRPDGLDPEYEFVGWYDNSEGAGNAYVFSSMPKNDLILYAIWKAPEKTVTVQYKNGEKDDIITLKKGETISILTPVYEGHDFEGWYTTDATGKEVEFDVNAPVTKNITVYAKWSEKTETTYTVHYYILNEKGEKVDVIEPKAGTGTVKTTINERAVKLTGEYSEYIANANIQSIELQSAESKNVIEFIYSPLADLKYSIVYQYEDKEIKRIDDLSAEAREFDVYPDNDIAIELNELGYKISEKYVQAKLTSHNASNVIRFHLLLSDYSITYNLDGGVINNGENPTSYNVNTPDFTLVNPTKQGYTFLGWTTSARVEGSENDGQTADPSITVKQGSRGHLTFTANWEPAEVNYTVEFYYQQKDGTYPNDADITDSERKAVIDTVISVNDGDKTPDPSKKGYIFDSEYELNVLQGIVQASGTTVLKVYFKRAVAEYQVKYHYQNLKDEYSDSINVEKTGTIGELTDVDAEEGKKEGFILSVKKHPDGEIQQKTIDADNITCVDVYYDRIVYTIIYDLNGGEIKGYTGEGKYEGGSVVFSKKYGSDMPTVPDPEKQDARFTGWEPKVNANQAVTGSKEYVAQWEQLYYVIYQWKWDEKVLDQSVELYESEGAEAEKVSFPTVPADNKGYAVGEKYELVDAAAAISEGKTYFTHDKYGNNNGKYTFKGWAPETGEMTAAGATITGTWQYETITPPSYEVIYQWEVDFPDDKLFNSEGEKVVPVLPEDKSTYVKGQGYELVDAAKAYTESEAVYYTQDEYGNKTAEYTFASWAPYEGTIEAGNAVITGKWKRKEISVEERTRKITYSWNLESLMDSIGTEQYRIPDEVTMPELPGNVENYIINSPHTVERPDPNTMGTQDEYGNTNGRYEFLGWKINGEGDVIDVTEPLTFTEDTEIVGTWQFVDTGVAMRTVSYEWSGLPEGYGDLEFFIQDDEQKNPVIPETKWYVNNQKYTVDTNWTSGMELYTKDEYGNKTAIYRFGGWEDPGEGTMGEENIVISGTWLAVPVPVIPTWKVSYSWNLADDVPEGVTLPEEIQQALPVDSTTYINNMPFVNFDRTFTAATTVANKDSYGNVIGIFQFSGWTLEENKPVPATVTKDMDFEGVWTYRDESANLPKYSVSYKWMLGTYLSLPEERREQQELDAAGLPETIEGLVNNQLYKNEIDTDRIGIKVYALDEYGNRTMEYELIGWNGGTESGKIEGRDVELEGKWKRTPIPVTKSKVIYTFSGNIPDGAKSLLPEVQEYFRNQPVTMADRPGVSGYIFNGWTVTEGSNVTLEGNTFKMPDGDVTITGSWEADFSGITAGKIMEVYSGETYSVPLEGTIDGDLVQFFVDGEEVENAFKDAASRTVTVRVIRGEEVFEQNVEVTISPRLVTLKSADLTEKYTGEEFTNHTLVTESGWVESEKADIEYVFTGKQQLVGESDNTFTAASADKQKVKMTNYNIQYEYGTLTVTDGSTQEPLSPEGVVTKTHEDREYGRGDVITFTITAVNIYDEVKTITITEQAGVTITGESVFDNVQPGAMVETTAVYEVTDEDIVRGSFSNTVTVSYSGGTTIEQIDEVDDIEEPDGHLTLTKRVTSTPANGAAYALGETITYEIRALNDGNLTLTDVVVTDDLTGDKWTIDEIAPGQRSTAMTTSYTVTEEDVLAGSVINVATASGSSPEGPDNPPIVDPGEEEVPTVTQQPSLFAEKTASASADGGTYGLGEEVTYTIRVVNNGNVTISNVTVSDDLTGDSWTVGSLAPNESQTFTADYTVTEEDIRAGRIVNVVTASGMDPDGNPVDTTAEEEIATDVLDGSLNVVKTVTNPRTQYNVGDTIAYQIAVTNTGNVTLHNVRVEDKLTGTEGSVIFTELAGGILENDTVVLPELGVGETATIRCEYTVTRGDANASIGNRVEVISDEEDDPSGDETEVTPVENLYNLTIHYVYADGTMAAPDVTAQYLEGESFFHASPVIEGYTPDFQFLRTDVQGMPARDVELTVVYTANPVVVTPPADDDTPDDDTPPADDDTPADDTPPAPPADVPVVPPADDTPVVPAPPAVPVVPAPPAVPVVPAPDDEALVEVEEEPVPTGGAVVEDNEGNLSIIPVEDEEVPLTNRQLDDHVCCILSFLMMLAAMIVYTCFTGSMKKRQKKIAGLRDQYEAEILRRKLGHPNETDR